MPKYRYRIVHQHGEIVVDKVISGRTRADCDKKFAKEYPDTNPGVDLVVEKPKRGAKK